MSRTSPFVFLSLLSAFAPGCGLAASLVASKVNGALQEGSKATTEVVKDIEAAGDTTEVSVDPTRIIETPDVIPSQPLDNIQSLSRILPRASGRCGAYVSRAPAFSVKLEGPAPASFRMAIGAPDRGQSHQGIIVVGPDGALREGCLGDDGFAATETGAPWPKGTYEVYVTSVQGFGDWTLFLAMNDIERKAAWRSAAPAVQVPGSLSRAIHLDVPLQAARAPLPGDERTSCAGAGAPSRPDVRVVIDHPAKGLVIRPLRRNDELRVWAQIDPAGYRFPALPGCVKSKEWRPLEQPFQTPSYRANQELHVPDGFVGEIGLTFGSRATQDAGVVAVMLFDATTAFDPTFYKPIQAPHPLGLDDRKVARSFPELDLRRVLGTSPGMSEDDLVEGALGLTAKLFELAPLELFVYPRREIELERVFAGISVKGESISSRFYGVGTVAVDEPLLPLFSADETTLVLVTMDGVPVQVAIADLALTPTGQLSPVGAPRPIATEWKDLARFADTKGRGLIAKYDERESRWLECRAKIEERLGALVDRATVEVESGRHTLYVKGGEAKRIEAQIEPTQNQTCGTQDALGEAQDATVAAVMKLIAPRRDAMMATARARFR